MFATFAEAFNAAKGVGHRKAIVYTIHELFTINSAPMAMEDRRRCLQKFLVPIGDRVRKFTVEERKSYCKLTEIWKKLEIFLASDWDRLKIAWDVD